MSRRAARRDEGTAHATPSSSPDVVLDDPALAEALAEAARFGRLSDDDVRAMRAVRRHHLAAGGAAALVLMVGAGVWSNGWLADAPPVPAHYETKRGQQMHVRLADGSTLHLNGATRIDVTLGDRERLIELRQGEAYFDVAHEADRPFVVHAGESGTRVLGTAFNIDLARGDVKLAVYRGKVRFGGYAASGTGVLVPAGWRSRFSHGVVRVPSRFDASQQDWRQAWVDTDDMQLGELVDTLNRRGGPLVLPPPPNLAGIALSGRFKLDNPEQLLGAIGDAYGFRILRTGDRLRLLPSPDGDAESSSQ